MKRSIVLIALYLIPGFILSQTELKDSLAKHPVNMTVKEFEKRTSIQNKLVLVSFSADWCLACKKQKPILDQIQAEKKGILELIIVDMEENPLIASEYNIDALPVLLIYKNKQMVWSQLGLKTKNELLKQISSFE